MQRFMLLPHSSHTLSHLLVEVANARSEAVPQERLQHDLRRAHDRLLADRTLPGVLERVLELLGEVGLDEVLPSPAERANETSLQLGNLYSPAISHIESARVT